MSEWQERKLGDIADVRDGTHDSPKEKPTGKSLVTSRHIKLGKVDLANTYKISDDDFDEINRRSKVDKWDILFSMIGTVGEMAIIDFEPDFAIKNVGLFKTGDKDLARWIYYYLKSTEAQSEITASRKGSTQEYITLGDLRKFPILFPPLPEQKAIAAVLSSLDDKIDLLHRQNQTLEAMAETLFRQWFIEAAPQPSPWPSPSGRGGEMEAQGEWKEGVLGDVVSVKGGTTPSTKQPAFWDGDIHWTTPRDLSNHNAVFLFDTERKITEQGLAEIGSGLLPVGTVLLSSRAPIGYLAIADIPVAINQGYIAMVCDKGVSNRFMYLWCKANMETIKGAGNGSTFEEISKSNFKSLPLSIPPPILLTSFQSSVAPLFQKIRCNQIQIRTLENLRDNLLPKLMSGEVRVEV